MDEEKEEKTKYFDYLLLARKELPALLQEYPELKKLSPREREVFAKLLTDKTIGKIAEELFILYSSARFHCKNIYRKLGVKSRREILIKYKEL